MQLFDVVIPLGVSVRGMGISSKLETAGRDVAADLSTPKDHCIELNVF